MRRRPGEEGIGAGWHKAMQRNLVARATHHHESRGILGAKLVEAVAVQDSHTFFPVGIVGERSGGKEGHGSTEQLHGRWRDGRRSNLHVSVCGVNRPAAAEASEAVGSSRL